MLIFIYLRSKILSTTVQNPILTLLNLLSKLGVFVKNLEGYGYSKQLLSMC